jgi:hypothetical protein
MRSAWKTGLPTKSAKFDVSTNTLSTALVPSLSSIFSVSVVSCQKNQHKFQSDNQDLNKLTRRGEENTRQIRNNIPNMTS